MPNHSTAVSKGDHICEPVVCFGCYDYWSSNPGSPIKIMDAIHARGHKVLWINNIGMNMPRFGREGIWKRIFLRLRAWSRWLRSVKPGFYLMAPIILPLVGNRTIEMWNDKWLLLQIRIAYSLLGLKRPIALVTIPTFSEVVARLPREGMIYYYTDKYDAYRDLTARDSIVSRDRTLFESADLVLCASKMILAELMDKRPHVHYLPHAVDFQSFNKVLQSNSQIPADMADIPAPRVGYFGSLSDSNDIELIRYAAEKDLSLQFVLIGHVLGDYSRVSHLPNVHLLGFKPYEEIPLYGKYFNVGIMNWKMTEWVRHCSPVKTKEYLSLGLPIVSVPIEEVVVLYPDLVEFAETGPEFLAAIHKALAEDSPESRQQRIDRVRGESWDARVEDIFRLYRKALHGD